MGVDLITRAEYKAYVGISSTTQDAIIDSIIPKVSALVKKICRRTFIDYVDDPKVEQFNGGEFFFLKESPVISVQSVEVSTDYGANYTSLVEYIDYVLDRKDEVIRPVSTTEFTNLINGYKVTYYCGYEELPEDLKLAILDLVTYYLKNDAVAHSAKSTSSANVQVEYITTTNLPAHIKRVLDLHANDYL